MIPTSSAPYGTHQTTDYNSYIMNPNNKIVEMRNGGRFNQSIILKYQDDTEWVFLSNKPEERFCGFLYLQKELKKSNLNKIQASENKIAIHDRKIIYLSRWHGDKKPDFSETDGYTKELLTLEQDIGFTDMSGNANLRKKDDVIYVFDTEKHSFDRSVHEKIDSFVHQHKAIREILEKSF